MFLALWINMAQAYLRDNNVSVATDEVRIMPYNQNPNPQKCTFFCGNFNIFLNWLENKVCEFRRASAKVVFKKTFSVCFKIIPKSKCLWPLAPNPSNLATWCKFSISRLVTRFKYLQRINRIRTSPVELNFVCRVAMREYAFF